MGRQTKFILPEDRIPPARYKHSPDLPPSPYGLKAGLYELAATPRNLPILPATPDNRADLGDVTLN